MWLNTLILMAITVILISVLFGLTVSLMVFNVSPIYWLADASFFVLSLTAFYWWIGVYRKCKIEQKCQKSI